MVLLSVAQFRQFQNWLFFVGGWIALFFVDWAYGRPIEQARVLGVESASRASPLRFKELRRISPEPILGKDNRSEIPTAYDDAAQAVGMWVKGSVLSEGFRCQQSECTVKASSKRWTLGERLRSDSGVPACETERFVSQKLFGFCSGFLLSADLVVTAAHCLEAAESEGGISSLCGGNATARWLFGFKFDPANQSYSSATVRKCIRTVWGKQDTNSPVNHVAILWLEPLSEVSVQPLTWSTRIDPQGKVSALGHPLGLPQKLSTQASAEVIIDDDNSKVLSTSLDVFRGSSGGPVFSGGKVIGVVTGGDRGKDFEVVSDGAGGKCSRLKRVAATGDGNRVSDYPASSRSSAAYFGDRELRSWIEGEFGAPAE